MNGLLGPYTAWMDQVAPTGPAGQPQGILGALGQPAAPTPPAQSQQAQSQQAQAQQPQPPSGWWPQVVTPSPRVPMQYLTGRNVMPGPDASPAPVDPLAGQAGGNGAKLVQQLGQFAQFFGA
jgi:hypothetical protein